MINDIVNFFIGLVNTGSNAAEGFLGTGSAAAEGVGNLVLGSLGDFELPAA